MDVREKLVELLDRFVDDDWYSSEEIAENLIANGVTVQDEPLKVVVSSNIDEKELMERLRNAPIQIMPSDPVQEWISVKDRLPEQNIRVLVWMQDNEEEYTQIDTDRWSCTMEQGYHWIRWWNRVTHWMPLPQPPKGE